VKRFLNAFILRKKLAKVARLENIKDEVLVKLMILEYTSDELFKELFTRQSQQAGFPSELVKLETALAGDGTGYDEAAKGLKPAWLGKSARQWVAMVPPLSPIDLRDYFWIARDKLDSTFSGLSMVSPLTRSVLNNLLAGTAPQRIAGIAAASELSEQELPTLYEYLEQAIMRHPEDKKGFDAMRSLTEKKISGSAERLNAILMKVPLNLANPAVALDINTLVIQRPELRSIFQASLDRIAGSKEKIGAALKTTTKGSKS
jgi:hypothetical protein